MLFSKKFSLPLGFSFMGVNAGLKKEDLDFGVIYSTEKANAAAVFTENVLCGAPLVIGKKHLKKGFLNAIAVNSKNANVHTGEQGLRDALLTCELVAEKLNLPNAELVLPSSTGVIGEILPMDKIKRGIECLDRELGTSRKNFTNFCRAILTTDTTIKWAIVEVGKAKLVGIAKGAGMVSPSLATMLVFLLTDAKIAPHELKAMLKKSVSHSFNSLTIDGDMSTSDTVAIMANGLAGEVDLAEFYRALHSLNLHLGQKMLRDGEGITKVIELRIKNCSNSKDAEAIAKSILNSFLVKTAIFGESPNWGRIIMAIGKTKIKKIKPHLIKIFLLSRGKKILLSDVNLPQNASNYQSVLKTLKKKEVTLEIDLNLGDYEKTFWGTDVSDQSVKLNAEYIS